MNKTKQFDIGDDPKRYGLHGGEAVVDDSILREQPYYRYGMSKEEAAREEEYMNRCIESNPMMFYEGKYTPLWKQNLYR